jgi:hypothetical protein
LAFDKTGNLYVSMNTPEILKITPRATVLPFASAQSRYPPSLQSIAFDSRGDLYVVDRGNHEIDKVTPAGAVSTVVSYSIWGWTIPGCCRRRNVFLVEQSFQSPAVAGEGSDWCCCR